MTFKKGIVTAFVLSAVMVISGTMINTAIAKPDGFSTHSDIIYKRLTRVSVFEERKDIFGILKTSAV